MTIPFNNLKEVEGWLRFKELQDLVKGAPKKNLYWIVDVTRPPNAFSELITECENGHVLQWPVRLSPGGPSLIVLNQSAGSENAGNLKRYSVRTTFWCSESSKWQVRTDEEWKSWKITVAQTAYEFENVSDISGSTIKQSSRTVSQLDFHVFHEAGNIAGSEILRIMLNLERRKQSDFKAVTPDKSFGSSIARYCAIKSTSDLSNQNRRSWVLEAKSELLLWFVPFVGPNNIILKDIFEQLGLRIDWRNIMFLWRQ